MTDARILAVLTYAEAYQALADWGYANGDIDQGEILAEFLDSKSRDEFGQLDWKKRTQELENVLAILEQKGVGALRPAGNVDRHFVDHLQELSRHHSLFEAALLAKIWQVYGRVVAVAA
jgi:hypothetical protein